MIRVKLTRMRDVETASPIFRQNLVEIATLLAFAATRDFDLATLEVRTPLSPCAGSVLKRPVIAVPILRAGLGMVEGFLRVVPEASVGHIGMFRNETTLQPESYYFKQPTHLADAEVVILDPMLATGYSGCAAVDQLKKVGARRLRLMCVLACPEGVATLRAAHPDVPIFVGAIDEGLDERGYIVPGLGDAGDRCFGTFSEKRDA